MHPRLSRWSAVLALLACVGLASCGGEGGGHGGSHGGHAGAGHGKKSAGHGSSPHSAPKRSAGGRAADDGAELLDLLEVGGQSDPSRFVELEIGSFRVTHQLADEGEQLVVKFRLFGIVSESKEERLHHELPKYESRIRDAVISLVQKTEAEQLAEPGLKWLKAELVGAINRVVQDRALSGVAFSDFSLEEV